MESLHSLHGLVAELHKTVAKADEDRSFLNAEAICRVSRELWFAYHEQWLADHVVCRRWRSAVEADLQRGLTLIRQILADALAAGGSRSGGEAGELELLGKYAESVQRRIELLTMLHDAPSAQEGARRVFARVRSELVP